MKLTLYNFGPIKEFELDLSKDIQFIYGENSVGKSYAVSCLYSVVKILISEFPYRILWEVESEIMTILEKNKPLLQIMNGEKLPSKSKRKKEEIDISLQANKIFRLIFERYVLKSITQSLKLSFTSLQNLNSIYSTKEFALKITLEEYEVTISYNKNNVIGISKFHSTKKTVVLINNEKHTWTVSSEGGSSGIRLLNNNESIEEDNLKWVRQMIFDRISKNISRYLFTPFSEIYFLPASKSGLMLGLNSLSPIIAALSKNLSQLPNHSITLPMLSEPIADYYVQISTINNSIVHLIMNSRLAAIAAKIEKTLLHGKVEFDSSVGRILFRPEGMNFSIELQQSSSMVAELAPLVAYLRFVISELKDESHPHILIIEEPEAHLHPKAQVLLMEILAELPKLNVKVILTSHSNYMFNKLGNMMLAGEIDEQSIATYHLVMTPEGSVDKKDMKVTREVIEDGNFSGVSEELYEERVNLYEQMEPTL